MKTLSNDQPGDIGKNDLRLAKALGWFAVGLGLTQLLLPNMLARLIGVKTRRVFMQGLGVRELMSGIGILSSQRPTGWLWARVLGDAMDLGLLGMAFQSRSSDRNRVEAAAAAVAGVTALDIYAAQRFSRASLSEKRAISVVKSITISRSPEELYSFWRNFENLPRFMQHLESVRMIGQNRSRWVAKAPAGTTVAWDAEITEESPNEFIAWRSMPGAMVPNSGRVSFEPLPGDRGTIVRVDLEYKPPGGILASKIAKLFGEEPEQQIHGDLHRFEQLMETGQITTTEGQPAGRSRSTSRIYDNLLRH